MVFFIQDLKHVSLREIVGEKWKFLKGFRNLFSKYSSILGMFSVFKYLTNDVTLIVLVIY